MTPDVDLTAIGAACESFLDAVRDGFENDVSHFGPSVQRLREAVRAGEAQDGRIMALSQLDLHRLSDACIRLRQAFPMSTFLVGSAVTRTDYRDVDVRTILADDEFDVIFAERDGLWSLFCIAVSEYLRHTSGLPVDYQVQRKTEANDKYGDQPRHPLGHAKRFYADLGDATQFRVSVEQS